MLPSRRVPRSARDAYRLDRLSSFLTGAYIGAIFPFVGVIAREQLHAGAFVLSIMAAAPFVGNLFALFWARSMEGKPKLPFMIWPQIVARSVFLLTVFATTPLRFALIVGAAQLIATISTPAYAAVIKEIYPDDQRGRIMSYTRAALFTTGVIVTFVSGPLLEYVSYRWVFPIAALYGLAAAWVFSRVPMAENGSQPDEGMGQPPNRALSTRPRREPGARSWELSLRETLTFLLGTLSILRDDHRFRWFALSVFTYGFGNLVLTPIITIVQVDELKISTASIALLANLSQVVAAVAYFYWGRYVDRHNPVRAVILNIALNAFIPLCYYYAVNLWYLVPAFILSGITMAGIDLSYFNSVLGFAGERNATRYQALQSFLLGIRGSIAPFVGSALMRLFRANGWEIRAIFLIGLAFILVGWWMQVMGLRGKGSSRCQAPGSRPGGMQAG
jgi:MFS family permease